MMQLDDLLLRYFHDTDMSSVSSEMLASGVERCVVDFSLAQDRRQRFSLWFFLHLFGAAPNLDVAFEDEEDREVVRRCIDFLAATEGES